MNEIIPLGREYRSDDFRVGIVDRPHRVASADLLRGKRKLIIEHGETTYVLVLTRNGKLILNK